MNEESKKQVQENINENINEMINELGKPFICRKCIRSQMAALQETIVGLLNEHEGSLNSLKNEIAKVVREFEKASGRVVQYYLVNFERYEDENHIYTKKDVLFELVPIKEIERAFFTCSKDLD